MTERLRERGHILLSEEPIEIAELSPLLAEAHAWWLSLRGDPTEMPSYETITELHASMLDRCSAFEVDWTQGLKIEFLRVKPTLREIYGEFENIKPQQYRILLKRQFLEVAFAGEPRAHRITIKLGGEEWHYDRISLPCSTDDPHKPGAIVTFSESENTGREGFFSLLHALEGQGRIY